MWERSRRHPCARTGAGERRDVHGKGRGQLAAYNGKTAEDTIYAGQKLKLPVKTASAARTYTVKAGDSWWSIAASQIGDGSRYSELAKLNGKTAVGVIHPGDVIKLP